MLRRPRETSLRARGRRASTAIIAMFATFAVTGCSGSSDGGGLAQTVVVPNSIIGHVVERVACTGGVDVRTPSDAAAAGADPAIVISLQRPSGDQPAASDESPLHLAVVDLVTTAQVDGIDDAWVWLDPARLVELSQGLAGGLVLAEVEDPAVVDRCTERFRLDMENLFADIESTINAVPVDLRVVDVAEPGMATFADAFGFRPATSSAAVEAGRILSTDDLGGFDTYEEMLVDRVGTAADRLTSG